MSTHPLYADLFPSFSTVINTIRSNGTTFIDSHKLIDVFEKTFPVDYSFGLQAFEGNYTCYHAYLGRMLFHNKFGYTNHSGFVNSHNCFGKKSRNSIWHL